ncbi:sigma factor [Sphingopyxis kveilinensis]|uniref:sigma factor n=1 Tax=Sphingopyxis kveilinensis TaxID=3114367 RepID=UPI003BB1B790
MTSPSSFTSFDGYYRCENRQLFHFLRRRVGRQEASDLSQEVFTRMLRTEAFERVENPQSYLFRAARDLVIEHSRKGTEQFPFDDDHDAPADPEQTLSMEASDLRRGYAARFSLDALVTEPGLPRNCSIAWHPGEGCRIPKDARSRAVLKGGCVLPLVNRKNVGFEGGLQCLICERDRAASRGLT